MNLMSIIGIIRLNMDRPLSLLISVEAKPADRCHKNTSTHVRWSKCPRYEVIRYLRYGYSTIDLKILP